MSTNFLQNLITLISGIILLFLTSCGGPPKSYLKAERLYEENKYDSARFYFNIISEEGNYYDSPRIMKKQVITALVDGHLWDKCSVLSH